MSYKPIDVIVKEKHSHGMKIFSIFLTAPFPSRMALFPWRPFIHSFKEYLADRHHIGICWGPLISRCPCSRCAYFVHGEIEGNEEKQQHIPDDTDGVQWRNRGPLWTRRSRSPHLCCPDGVHSHPLCSAGTLHAVRLPLVKWPSSSSVWPSAVGNR